MRFRFPPPTYLGHVLLYLMSDLFSDTELLANPL